MLIEKGKGKAGAGEGRAAAEGEGATVVVPPDGGWGWMVVFGSFMIHLIADGMAYSFGVYVESFLDHFDASRSEVGFLGSLMLGVTWGSGPIASMLTNKYGCRLVAILGTVIAAIGFLMSIFAPNIYFMYFSFGIVAGVGLGFAYLPAIVAVSFYFEKRRSLATGLAVCGSGFGTFIFAPLTQLLLDEYGWKGTVLIEIGLLLNCIPCGAVFRPVEAPRPRRPSGPMANQAEEGSESTVEKVKGFDSEARAEPAEAGLGNAGVGGIVGGGGVDVIEKPTTPTSMTDEPQFTTSDPTSDRSRLRLSSTASSSASAAAASSMQVVPVIGPMDRKDVYYNRSLQNIPLYRSDPDMYRRSIVSIPRANDDDGGGGGGCRCLGGGGGSDGGSTTSRQPMMDCSLMIDPCFLLFAISNLLTSVGYVVAYIFLPNRATVSGISETQAASLISIIGISNTVGRILFGFLADYKWVNRLMLYNTALVLCGVMSLLSALCYNYPWMAAYAASFGLFIGVYICLTPIVIVDLLGLDKLSNAFGIVLLFQGIGTVLGPPLAGAVYDITKDYNNSFYLMGACITFSGAMLYVIPCIQRRQERTSTSDGHLAVVA